MSRVTVDKDKLIGVVNSCVIDVECSNCHNFLNCKARHVSTIEYMDCKIELLRFLEVEDNE